ncbi:ERV/ALR sulfhydryl oxidase domain-containing protein [Chytriomyces sp. MP71]|nr:ERV/ALR sulfhydryl oxidase domain-containing protein [Chytriomyces sp. MP71]
MLTEIEATKAEKPCRVCDGFKTFTKDQSKKEKKKTKEAAPVAGYKMECPPDSRQLGRHTWTFLHTMAAYYPENPTESEQKNASTFMRSFAKLYPCSYCADHLQHEIKKNPPKVSSANEFSLWMCGVHNEVNERLGKPQFDCSKVFERWRDGCDE